MSTFDSELYHHEKAVKNINYIYPSTSKQWRGTRGHLLWSNGDACSWGWHWHLIRWIKWCESDSFFLPWIRSTKQLLGLLHTHVEIVVIMILVAVRGVRVARFHHTRSWIENLICNSPRAQKNGWQNTVGQGHCMCNWVCNIPSVCNRAHWFLGLKERCHDVSVSQTMRLRACQHDRRPQYWSR